MKYTRLSKEQLEELHPEFINFLATQSITGDEWAAIKEKQPEVAEQEIDVFSDLIWEGVLSKATYLEHISPQQMFLFEIAETKMNLIGLKVNKTDLDITSPEGYEWLRNNYASDDVEFFKSSKGYSNEKNADIFELIQQGSVITKGALFEFFKKIVNG